MTVSAVLPNYNYARYLKERIRSVLNQTHRELELIYLDDASRDESNSVAAQFSSDARMRMHCFEQNSGQVYQRWNDGAALAQGDWLWFAGADDSAHVGFLEHLLSLSKRYPSAGVLRCDFMRIDSDGRIIQLGSQDSVRWPRDTEDHFGTGAAEICRAAVSGYPTASSLLIRRDVFERVGGFDVRVRFAADTLLYLQAVSLADAVYSRQALAMYRDHPVTFTRSTSMIATDFSKCYCMAKALRILDDQGLDAPAERERLERWTRFRLSTILCTSGATIPANLEWMIPAVRRIVPDSPLFRVHAYGKAS